MQYRSFEDLNRALFQNLHKALANVDLMIGIPLSGLMAANIFIESSYRQVREIRDI